MLSHTIVVVVPDDDKESRSVPPGILKMLTQNNVLMSNDNHRMYVRRTNWERMKESFMLTEELNIDKVVDASNRMYFG
jgi:hypothetical protein